MLVYVLERKFAKRKLWSSKYQEKSWIRNFISNAKGSE